MSRRVPALTHAYLSPFLPPTARAGAYYHELFIRPRPDLHSFMRRVGKPHLMDRRKHKLAEGDDPNFYAMPAVAEAPPNPDLRPPPAAPAPTESTTTTTATTTAPSTSSRQGSTTAAAAPESSDDPDGSSSASSSSSSTKCEEGGKGEERQEDDDRS
jgi:hypothetical protein